MNPLHEEIAGRLQASLSAGISDEAMKPIKKAADDIMCRIQDDVEYRLKEDLAPILVDYVAEMAKRTVEEILKGNEDQMRRYLSCEQHGQWTGRSTGYAGNRAIEDQHPIIRGDFFEQGAIALRRDIVNAHRELLVNERILDLEDQVKSLVAQVNKANDEKDKMWERLRAVQ